MLHFSPTSGSKHRELGHRVVDFFAFLLAGVLLCLIYIGVVFLMIAERAPSAAIVEPNSQGCGLYG